MVLPDPYKTIEHIYAAALDPGCWKSALQDIQNHLRSTASGLYVQDKTGHAFKAVELIGFETGYQKSYAEYYAKINPWFGPERCLMQPGLISTDQTLDDYYDQRNWLQNTEFFNDWMAPQGFRYRTGGTLSKIGSTYINFTYLRSKKDGPYSADDQAWLGMVSPHLVKAIEINRQLGKLNLGLQAASYLVDQLQYGVVLLDARGRITFVNRMAESLLRENDGLTIKSKRIKACHPGEDRELQVMIEQATGFSRKQPATGVNRLLVSRMSARPRLSLIVLPLVAHQQILSVEHSCVAIFISDPGVQLNIEKRYLEQCYGLSSQEARIAQRLVQGGELRAIARELGLSYETARWYLKKIFEKTGTHRQSELICLLASDLAARISSRCIASI
jgi:DNA-binding CsgD family transcriptional regulator